MENVDLKLKFEQKNMSELRRLLEKNNDLTDGMCTILNSFDERLEKLEKTITPVYKQTGNLQKRQENINIVLKKLDCVIPYYNVGDRLKLAIHRGPSQDIREYIETIDELKSALSFFEKSNPQNTEVPLLKTLIHSGQNSLLQHFEDMLNKYSKPLAAFTILDLIEIDEELRSLDSTKSLDQIPKGIQDDLREMAAYLQESGLETKYTEIYGSIRSRTLLGSMQQLKDHERSCSGSSNHLMTIGVSNSSPLVARRSGAARDAHPRRVGRKIQDAIFRRAGLRRQSDATNRHLLHVGKVEKEDIEVEGFLTSITALLKLMQSEAQLLKAILPDRKLASAGGGEPTGAVIDKSVFEHVVQAAVCQVMADGENLDKSVRLSSSRQDYQVVLSLFPALQHLTQIRPDYESLMEGCTQKDLLCKQSVRMQTTLNKSLQEFVESVKNDPETRMPKDGTVHELTSNVMMLLERLLTFVDMVGNVLAVSDLKKLSKAEDPNKCTLSQYVHRVLSALSLNINNKAESYSDEYLKAVFRLNNLHYVYQSLQRSSLLEVVTVFYPNMGEHYMENLREEKRKYSQSWSHVLHYIVDADRTMSGSLTPKSPSGSLKLKDKERQAIKDKFSGFNKSMDEITKTQKMFAIPDVELRETIKRDNKEFIVPKYRLFYETYGNNPFTKNVDKYIKYSPIQVSEMIDQFFDASA